MFGGICRRLGTWVLIVIMVLVVGACENVLAPVFPLSVELRAPKYSYGRPASLYYWHDGKEGFACEYVIYVQASGGHGSSNRLPGEWVGGILQVQVEGSADAPEITSLAGSEVEGVFGYGIAPGDKFPSGRFLVEGPELPFSWTLEVSLYDPDANKITKASVGSRCVDPT